MWELISSTSGTSVDSNIVFRMLIFARATRSCRKVRRLVAETKLQLTPSGAALEDVVSAKFPSEPFVSRDVIQ